MHSKFLNLEHSNFEFESAAGAPADVNAPDAPAGHRCRVQACADQCQRLQINAEAQKSDANLVKLRSCVAKCRAFCIATEHVQQAACTLKAATGADLALAGAPYPPAQALRKAALHELCMRILLRATEGPSSSSIPA
jgi:hypothetical protein